MLMDTKNRRIIGLDFIQTRLKGNETAGAEVDVLFDSSRLLYTRWQVQCKNTHRVSLDQIAKEVIRIQETAKAIAQLDVLASFATVSTE